VDASASTAGFRCALLSTRPGGTCVIRSVSSGINLVAGPPHASPHVPDVLKLIDDGILDPPPAEPVFTRSER
jgi:alcohol dehydrogenase